MLKNLSFKSLTNAISTAYEPGYQAYLRFKSDLEHRPEEALRNIVSQYAVITNQELHPQAHEAITQLMQSNSDTALASFYDDIINHLVELSASQMNGELLMTNVNIDTFNQMLAFYQPYVPEEIYQAVLKQIQSDNTIVQRSILTVTKKINQTFQSIQLAVNHEIEEEKPLSQHQELHHSINAKQLIVMGAIGLLAHRHSFRLEALFADAKPIPTQYVQPGQALSYGIDLNQVFNDTDGNIMTYGVATPFAVDTTTSGTLLSSALLLSTTGLGFLAKNRKTERPKEGPVEVVENSVALSQ